jgi:hypothetical protein
VGVVSLLSGLVLQGITAVPGVLNSRDGTDARFLVVQGAGSTGLFAQHIDWNWRDRFAIRTIQVAAEGPGRTALPGLPRPLATGDVWVSDGVREVMREDGELARAFPVITGTIDPAVLPNPRAKYVYVGLSAEQMRAKGFTASARLGVKTAAGQPELEALLMLTAVLFLVVPLVMLLVASYSLLTVPRRAQVETMVAMGVPLRRARFLTGLDGLVVASGSGLLSIPLFIVLGRLMVGVPGTPASWQPGQPEPTKVGLITALTVPFVAALWATRQGRRGDRRPRRARTAHVFLVVPAVSGMVGMVAARGLEIDASPQATMLAVGLVALLALTLPGLSAVLADQAGRRMLAVARPHPTRLVAAARIARGISRSGRPARMMIAAVVLGVVIAPLVAQAAPVAAAERQQNEAAGRIAVLVTDVPAVRDEAVWAGVPGVIAVSRGRQSAQGRVDYPMTCQDAARLLRRSGCVPGRRTPTGRLARYERESLGGIGAAVVEGLNGGAAGRLGMRASSVLVLADEQALWRLSAVVRADAPLADVKAAFGGKLGGPDQSYAAMQTWLRLAMLQLLFVVGIVLLLACAEDTRVRLEQMRGLSLLGVGSRTLRAMVGCELGIRNGAIVVVSLLAVWIVGGTAERWSGADPLPHGWLMGIAAAVVSIGALATALPVLTVGRAMPASTPDRSPLGDR